MLRAPMDMEQIPLRATEIYRMIGWRRLASVRAIFPGYHSAIRLTVAYSAIFVTIDQWQYRSVRGQLRLRGVNYV